MGNKLKISIFRGVILPLLAVLCVGCAIQTDSALIPTAQYLAQNPVPLPDFLKSVCPVPGSVLAPLTEICATLYTGAVLEKGDTEASLQKQMLSSTWFSIDSHPLPSYVFIRYEIPAYTVEIINGVSTGWITLCFTPDLAVGHHLFTVNTTSSSGKTYEYSWALEVK